MSKTKIKKALPPHRLPKLTGKQKAFVGLYLTNQVIPRYTLAEIAKRAGYGPSISRWPNQIVSNPKVQAHLKRGEGQIQQTLWRSGITTGWVNGNLKAIIEDPEARTSDKIRALEILGRSLGMFKDTLKLEQEKNLVSILEARRMRMAKANGNGKDREKNDE